jgi:hypothetical protein
MIYLLDGMIVLKWIFKRGEGGGMDRTDLTQDRDMWDALVNVIINL